MFKFVRSLARFLLFHWVSEGGRICQNKVQDDTAAPRPINIDEVAGCVTSRRAGYDLYRRDVAMPDASNSGVPLHAGAENRAVEEEPVESFPVDPK